MLHDVRTEFVRTTLLRSFRPPCMHYAVPSALLGATTGGSFAFVQLTLLTCNMGILGIHCGFLKIHNYKGDLLNKKNKPNLF